MRAWSIRFLVFAGLLSGLEVALPFFDWELPPRVFSALMLLVVTAAFIARIVAQRSVPGGSS